jgi:mono/diheme cytochrome c family protein
MAAGVIIPGSPETSNLIIKMESGGHPGHLTPENLEIVRKWIQNGAPSGDTQEEQPAVEEEQQAETPPEPEELTEPEQEVEEELLTGEIPEYFWDSDIQLLFENKCSACHGADSVSGLDLRTYNSVMDSGVIIPGDPDLSALIDKIEIENHPGTLTPDEISMIRAWIWNDAPESEGAGIPSEDELIEAEIEQPQEVEQPQEAEQPQAEPSSEAGSEEEGAEAGSQGEAGPEAEPESETESQTQTAYTWVDNIQPILQATCMTCHGSMALGGLDMTTYQSFMDSGVVEPGNPDGSLIVTKMVEGGHSAQLSDEDLEILRRWIAEGAVEGSS